MIQEKNRFKNSWQARSNLFSHTEPVLVPELRPSGVLLVVLVLVADVARMSATYIPNVKMLILFKGKGPFLVKSISDDLALPVLFLSARADMLQAHGESLTGDCPERLARI